MDSASPAVAPSRVLNVNVGILGHVDSGKTALAAAISESLSVAALDKHPQSQARGVTLDLGASAFQMPCPEDQKERLNCDVIQFALIDCPGHASLIKTVMVGAQIIDLMILVVDVTKGIQAQTAESIILGELLSSCMVVALNKVDLLPQERRMKHAKRAARGVLEALRLTRFADSELVPMSAKVGGDADKHEGIDALKAALLQNVPRVIRHVERPFLFMADHCFLVKGHGTVMSGNVLAGRVKVGDRIELPEVSEVRKVKSMQTFKVPVQQAEAGDRIGLCVTQLPPQKLERTCACAPGLLHYFSACICAVDRCRFFTGKVPSRKKVFITVGYQTIMAQPIFFGLPEGSASQEELIASLFNRVGKFANHDAAFDLDAEYLYEDELFGIVGRPGGPHDPPNTLVYGQEWVLLLFDKPILALHGCVMISTQLDLNLDQHNPACRIAFYGNVVHIFPEPAQHRALKLYKVKSREGRVHRVEDKHNVILIDMFKKETDLKAFLGMEVRSASGCRGVLKGSFGTTAAKVRAEFREPFPDADRNEPVLLFFKKYVFDEGIQSHAK